MQLKPLLMQSLQWGKPRASSYNGRNTRKGLALQRAASLVKHFK